MIMLSKRILDLLLVLFLDIDVNINSFAILMEYLILQFYFIIGVIYNSNVVIDEVINRYQL